MTITSHRDLIVWQKSMDLAVEAYRLAQLMPRSEQFRLTSQLLRSAASVPANIAEGHSRGTRKDYANFVAIARGSLAETDTLIVLATRAGLIGQHECATCSQLIMEISKMLTALNSRLRASP